MIGRPSTDLTLSIAHGEFVVLLGPTGAGKTTTLRLIAGLEKPENGTIHIAGRDATELTPAGRDVAFVFQQYSLYPHLSVYDNLAFPLRSPARKFGDGDIRARVEQVARLVRIDHKLDSRSTSLSGGEMQRVAIGRALVRRPAIYLMDEPLSSLDAKLRAELRLELKRIQADLGATVLYVTHDQIEAMTHGRPHRHPGGGPIAADRHAARHLYRAGQPARRSAARPAGDQPAADGAAARRRGAGRHDDHRRPHRASGDRQGAWRPSATAPSSGSSISATRTTFI